MLEETELPPTVPDGDVRGPEELCVFAVKELPRKELDGLPGLPAVLWVLDVKLLPPTEPDGETCDPEVI